MTTQNTTDWAAQTLQTTGDENSGPLCKHIYSGVNEATATSYAIQYKTNHAEVYTIHIFVFPRDSFEYSGKYCIDSTGYVNIKKVKWSGPIKLDSGNKVLDHYLAVVHRMNKLL